MIKAGEKLWSGAIVTPELARAYNLACSKVAAFEREGRPVPEYLLNGRHNLIAGFNPAESI